MNNTGIINALIEEIGSQLTIIGLTSFDVSRDFQPSEQATGADADSDIKTKIYLHSITNNGMGHSRTYNADNTKRADSQHLSKIVQVSVVHYFDYSDINAIDPEDMATTIRALLDSPDAIKSLRAKGVFLQEVGDVNPVFFINDKDQNELLPSFDLTLTYQSDIIKDLGYVDSVVHGVRNETS